MGIFSKLMSSGYDKALKDFEATVKEINEMEPRFQQMSDAELAGMTERFRMRLKEGKTLDDILPEAFAVVREMSVRTLGMRHFDVQLIGGMALHNGMIAEMRTGEGKTLVSTLAGYLNALPGKGVHIVTVNDYLAQRDYEQMSRLYNALGITTGLNINGMTNDKKIHAYEQDITYGTNSEFGFDYLRDNMTTDVHQRMQRREWNYAIVDEIDSILIDEARTPLIISGPGSDSSGIYQRFADAVRNLNDEDYIIDEAKHTIMATDDGLLKIEDRLGFDVYDKNATVFVNHLQQALKAEYLFHKDKEYIVDDGEVKIVDEFTGRIMDGRRYSDGLHQAIEAKEGVEVLAENLTLATVTLQNYFRLYNKLSGMTGTALTEDSEFRETYGIGVQPIPANRPIKRIDHNDVVYVNENAKFHCIVEDIAKHHEQGQPILIGTTTVEKSERLSRELKKKGIKHSVLNAKHHKEEAGIISQAGRYGTVTIATNMAGRGTDILLGGNPEELAHEYAYEEGIDPADITKEQWLNLLNRAKKVCNKEKEKVLEAGGLYVIGTERHEARRIDNQLRGRSGRQGDPGETRFYLSLDDDVIRLFGPERVAKMKQTMETLTEHEFEPIDSRFVTRSIEKAQHKIEEIHKSTRKSTLEYDDVMNKQRLSIYSERNKILDGKDMTDNIEGIVDTVVCRALDEYFAIGYKNGDRDGFKKWAEDLTKGQVSPNPDACSSQEVLRIYTRNAIIETYNKQKDLIGDGTMKLLTRDIMLKKIDQSWISYLQEMDYLKAGIGLRGFGQRDPLVEYKQEAFNAFKALVASIYEDYLRIVFYAVVAVHV